MRLGARTIPCSQAISTEFLAFGPKAGCERAGNFLQPSRELAGNFGAGAGIFRSISDSLKGRIARPGQVWLGDLGRQRDVLVTTCGIVGRGACQEEAPRERTLSAIFSACGLSHSHVPSRGGSAVPRRR